MHSQNIESNTDYIYLLYNFVSNLKGDTGLCIYNVCCFFPETPLLVFREICSGRSLLVYSEHHLPTYEEQRTIRERNSVFLRQSVPLYLVLRRKG